MDDAFLPPSFLPSFPPSAKSPVSIFAQELKPDTVLCPKRTRLIAIEAKYVQSEFRRREAFGPTGHVVREGLKGKRLRRSTIVLRCLLPSVRPSLHLDKDPSAPLRGFSGETLPILCSIGRQMACGVRSASIGLSAVSLSSPEFRTSPLLVGRPRAPPPRRP